MKGRTNAFVTSGGGISGATIQVTTSESTLIGQSCLLKLNNVTVKSATFNSLGVAEFSNVIEYGTYEVSATDGSSTGTNTVNVTAQNILDGDTVTTTINFITPLPVANVGDVIQIGGNNCMCIGTNRYLFMTNLGNNTWDGAVTSAQNWSVPNAITDLYNVSNTALMTKTEAEGLTQEQRQTLYAITNDGAWLGTESDSSSAYSINSAGGISVYGKSGSDACFPAFTIALKS